MSHLQILYNFTIDRLHADVSVARLCHLYLTPDSSDDDYEVQFLEMVALSCE